MIKSADIVIVGGGILGTAIAFQLARRGVTEIVILEQGMGPGEGSTGASSAICRHRYSHPNTIALARDGISAYRNWSEFLGLHDPIAHYHAHGMLWLSPPQAGWAAIEAERLSALNVAAEVLSDEDVLKRFPAVNPCSIAPDLEGGIEHTCSGHGAPHLFEPDGGYMDPVDALQDLQRAARARGVTLHFQKDVVAVGTSGGKVSSVHCMDGDTISAPCIINAAGPWCLKLNRLAGVDLGWPLEPTRIQIALVDRPSDVQGAIPVCADFPAGIYFRTQSRGQQFVVGSMLEQDELERVTDPDNFVRSADDAFVRPKLFALEHRIPRMSQLRHVRGYAGLYTVNRADMHPLVGKTSLEGFYVANGCSGHGFKLAPAIGSLLAQLIAGGRADFDTAVDSRFLAIDRDPIELTSSSVVA